MNNQNFSKIFTLYFIVFGIVISLFATFVSHQIQISNTKETIEEQAEEILQIKLKDIIKPSLNQMENIVVSIAKSQSLQHYIQKADEESFMQLEEIFLAVAGTNSQIMQLRFLDKNGIEKVRVDRNYQNEAPFVMEKNKLQDKSDRGYFKEVSTLKSQKIWYSKIDLNIENKKIEVPYKPTLRIAQAIFTNNQFSGMVIVNILIDTLMEQISTSLVFKHYIIDKDGYFIFHPENRYSWNRYTNVSRNLTEDFPKDSSLILQGGKKNENFFAYPLEPILQNGDGAIFILKPKEEYKSKLLEEKIQSSIIVILLSILLSVVMALYASRKPSRLQKALFLAHKKLTQFGDIIDKYVITVTTKRNSIITHSSSAFSQVCGYSKEELIGQKINIIRHPDTPKETFKVMWKQLDKNEEWCGEIKNKTKYGEEYWIKEHIIPVFDENNEANSFMSISVDITSQKQLEQISITDGLTNVFNRRYFNDTFPKVINSAKRENQLVSLLLIDIDHFKPYNDNYGHQAGDDVLIKFASCLKKSLNRVDDMVFRLGGEEFGIVYKSDTKEKALEFANTIRANIEDLHIKHEYNSASSYITASMGLICKKAKEIKDMEEVYKQVDDLLYKAKESGRNQVKGDCE